MERSEVSVTVTLVTVSPVWFSIAFVDNVSRINTETVFNWCQRDVAASKDIYLYLLLASRINQCRLYITFEV